MCLNLPGKVSKIGKEIILEYPGEIRKIDVSMVDLEIGDYVVVAAGVIVNKVDKKKAEEFLEVLND